MTFYLQPVGTRLNNKFTIYLYILIQYTESCFLLGWTACRVQDEHLIWSFWLICSIFWSSANSWHRASGQEPLFYAHCLSCLFFFYFNQQNRNGAQMTPFPAQWHHLAAEDSLNFRSCSPCSPPAHSFHRSLRTRSLVISLAS